jgi:hypothetical protein
VIELSRKGRSPAANWFDVVEGFAVIRFVRVLRFAFFLTFATAVTGAAGMGSTSAAVVEPLPVVELSLQWERASDNGDGTYANLFAVTLTNTSPGVLWNLELILVDARPHVDLAARSGLGVDVIAPGETLSLTWRVDSPMRLTPALSDHLVAIFAGEADAGAGLRQQVAVQFVGGR